MQKNKKMLFSGLLIFAVAFPFNALANEVIEENLEQTNNAQQQQEEPLKELQPSEELPTETEPVEVISTEESGEFYGLSEGIPTLEEVEQKKAEEKKAKAEKALKEKKEKKEKADKDAKDPYKGENLKKEKPRHYNTIYKGSKIQWEDKAVSEKRKKLKNSAEKMLGWDYSQEMRMKPGYTDCSSFVHLSLMEAGLMPKANYAFTTETMPSFNDYLEEISWEEIKVGDIILGDGHVAFYWGEDEEGHPITLESCGSYGVGYGYMMYGGWDFNYTSAWRVKNIDESLVKKVIPLDKGLVSIWDLVVDEKSLEEHEKSKLVIEDKEMKL